MPLWVNLNRIYCRKTDNAYLNLTNTEGIIIFGSFIIKYFGKSKIELILTEVITPSLTYFRAKSEATDNSKGDMGLDAPHPFKALSGTPILFSGRSEVLKEAPYLSNCCSFR